MATPQVRSSELQVRVVNRRLVKVSDHPKEPRADVITVSNLDLIPNTYQTSVLCIYPKPLTGDFDAVIHCRNQGAELVVSEAEVPLRSLDFGLADESLKRILLVSFACGGFSVAWSNNNLVLDGNSAMRLVRTCSELAHSETIAAVGAPSYDHSALRPRDPPSYAVADPGPELPRLQPGSGSPGPRLENSGDLRKIIQLIELRCLGPAWVRPWSYGSSLDEMFTPFDDAHLVDVLTARDSVVERLYYVEAQDIARLKAMASAGEAGQRASRVQAVSTYLWKSLAAAVGGASKRGPKATCRMGWSGVGNVTPYVVGEAAVATIQQETMAGVAAMVRDAITSVDYDERVQELVDWVEEHKGEDRVWASFPLDTDFGFGHAALAMPTWASEGLCSANLVVTAHPGGNGSWIISADLWARSPPRSSPMSCVSSSLSRAHGGVSWCLATCLARRLNAWLGGLNAWLRGEYRPRDLR
uniref:Uncharacterized protein n=1 Tax=Setaria italica TaxID=4555 RepID=K4ALL2_SETIT